MTGGVIQPGSATFPQQTLVSFLPSSFHFSSRRRLERKKVEARKREAEKERARRDRLYNLHRSFAGAGPAGRGRDSPVLKSSVDIQPEWTMLDQIPFSTFSKLSFAVPDPPKDLLVCGALEFYDRSFDRVNPKNERRLERFKSRNFFLRAVKPRNLRYRHRKGSRGVLPGEVSLSSYSLAATPLTVPREPLETGGGRGMGEGTL